MDFYTNLLGQPVWYHPHPLADEASKETRHGIIVGVSNGGEDLYVVDKADKRIRAMKFGDVVLHQFF